MEIYVVTQLPDIPKRNSIYYRIDGGVVNGFVVDRDTKVRPMLNADSVTEISTEVAIGVVDDNILVGSATLDFPSTGASSMSTLIMTVTGAAVGDPVAIGFNLAPTYGVIFTGAVTATDTVTIALHNLTASPYDAVSSIFNVRVFKSLVLE